jgi:hypothetical protein
MMSEDVDVYKLLSQGSTKFFNQKPELYFPILTGIEYTAGSVTRYFIRPANDQTSSIMEINETEFRVFSTNPFYTGVSIDWKITGPLDSVVINDIVHEMGVGDHNYTQLKIAEQSFSGMFDKLSDLYQFYKAS